MLVTYTALEGGATNPNGLLNIFGTNVTDVSNTGEVFSFIWVFGVVACVTAGAAVLAVAGVRLTAADSSAKALEVKKDMKRAVYGVLGILALWLILNQINPDLLRGDIRFSSISPSQSGGVSDSPDAPPTIPAPPIVIPPGAPGSESNIRTLLAADPQIRINNTTPCSGTRTTGCTSVQGMLESTISMLKALKTACNCEVMITGGTEPGHKSHGPGKSPVDLRLGRGDALYTFITSNGSRSSPTPSYCNALYVYNYWSFCDEKGGTPHWHVYQ